MRAVCYAGVQEFEMDREIKLELERQTNERVALVRRELAWESEKHRLALEKLRKRSVRVCVCVGVCVYV